MCSTDLLGYSPMFAAAESRRSLPPGDGRDRHRQLLPAPRRWRRARAGTILPDDDVPGAPRVVMMSTTLLEARVRLRTGRDRPHAADARQVVHDRRRAPRGVHRHGAVLAPEIWMPVSASLDVEPVGITTRSVADRHHAARAPRRSLDVHERPAEAGPTIDQARAQPRRAGGAARRPAIRPPTRTARSR